MAVKITKEKIQSYETVRQSGTTNMFNINTVIELADTPLTKKDCLEIMKNYSEYITKFKIKRGK